MMLYEAMMEDVVLMDRMTISDGLGGYTKEWHEGAEFKAAIVKDSSMQARTAEQQGVTSVYTITTYGTVHLSYHDVVKRASDGQIFRITSQWQDSEAPAVASFSMAQVTAEPWVLTND